MGNSTRNKNAHKDYFKIMWCCLYPIHTYAGLEVNDINWLNDKLWLSCIFQLFLANVKQKVWKSTGKLQIHLINNSAIYFAKKSYIFQFTRLGQFGTAHYLAYMARNYDYVLSRDMSQVLRWYFCTLGQFKEKMVTRRVQFKSTGKWKLSKLPKIYKSKGDILSFYMNMMYLHVLIQIIAWKIL